MATRSKHLAAISGAKRRYVSVVTATLTGLFGAACAAPPAPRHVVASASTTTGSPGAGGWLVNRDDDVDTSGPEPTNARGALPADVCERLCEPVSGGAIDGCVAAFLAPNLIASASPERVVVCNFRRPAHCGDPVLSRLTGLPTCG